MASITQQKADLRACLHGLCEGYLEDHPDKAIGMAMAVVRLLSSTYTLQQLQTWHIQFSTILAEMNRK